MPSSTICVFSLPVSLSSAPALWSSMIKAVIILFLAIANAMAQDCDGQNPGVTSFGTKDNEGAIDLTFSNGETVTILASGVAPCTGGVASMTVYMRVSYVFALALVQHTMT